MIVIPAIDLHEGHVVRLKKGVFENITIYSTDPGEVARTFMEAGARRIHVVDLDGSLAGRSVNAKAIRQICDAVTIEIELGGGIRSADDAHRMFSLGVSFVILGTMVIKDPSAAREMLSLFPGRIALGIDARHGMVAVHGWKESTRTSAVELAREYEQYNPAFIVYTDIERDGMMSGPNIEATSLMTQAIQTPVVASGGISSLDDIKALKNIPGLLGAITGKALYEGSFDLKEAIELALD
ncbi:MAG TPA: 1-(5-phosphoribosyl)-5-[(5-phosphoribosylamino)methylideneamino]imidazole-4-carboxamide isomerase [Deltaproteobacteria bacterium]|nr:1-(5-phosphoribosyl)-5-[(5-phosphoribosylamino)methylideneamino]imidazole-4-carboxamide isomerase [Deltaproteobacteria bacterium]